MQREAYKKLILSAFGGYDGWAELSYEEQMAVIRRIERGCYNKVINQCAACGILCAWTERKFAERYSAECYRIVVNLDPKSSVGSTYLGESILKGAIDANELSNMSNYELNPSCSAAERDEISLRNEQKVEQKVSKAYTCAKCGGKETTMKKYQGRAADEDVNISIRCVNCGAIWRK